jgi:CRP-like cAMP-binding protein
VYKRQDADDDEVAAQRLYDLALEFQERSQRSESRLLEQFEDAAGLLTARIGDLIINDDDDERLTLSSTGEFKAEVLTEEENEWRPLANAEELVEYYDPTDVFGDLADALAEAYPSIAPELGAETGATNGTGPDVVAEGDADGDTDEDESGEADEEGAPRA